jgi:hypothetical protein
VVLDANIMSKKKNWKRAAPGIWRNKSGMLYERPKINGRYTYRSLDTTELEAAKAEFHRRRAGVEPKPEAAPPAPTEVLVGQVIQRYQDGGCRDRHKQRRPDLTDKAENNYCRTLLGFWQNINVDDVTIAACDRYHWFASGLNSPE